MALTGTCTGSYDNVTSSYITSPNYPQNYGDSVKCTWMIVAPNENTIALNFTDFVIQAYSGYIGGTTDSLSVYNGSNDNALPLTTLSGSVEPFVILTGKTTYVKFTSHKYTTDKGFRILLKAYGS